MNRRVACLVAVWFLSTACVQGREVMNLDGVWNFATDPDGRGEAEHWFSPDAKLPKMPLSGYAPQAQGTIRVPGIWDNQGYGTETEKVRHNFVGKGWYQRHVEIPKSWAGQRVFLGITGVSRYAKTWVNGHFLGEHLGLLSAFEYDITPQVVPGQSATVVIQVDSKQRWEVDALYGTCTLADYMDVPWGGIWGHVRLEARADAWLSDLCVRPDVPGAGCSAGAVLCGRAELPDAVKLEIFDASGRLVAETSSKLGGKLVAGQTVQAQAAWSDAQLWTPDTPTLYQARLSLLKGAEVLDALESRFGMREFRIEGRHLLLNGKRLMLCGYGDDHVYPAQMAMPSDKELHRERLRVIKSYGFNFVRHHSAIMPPEYYEACDEIGMTSTAEFPICYTLHLPGVGDVWKKNVPPGTDPGPALQTYQREWEAVVRQYRNHPSILWWVMGNELYEAPRPIAEFAAIARRLDPTRPFADSDSCWGIPKGDKDRDTLTIYTAAIHEEHNPIDYPVKFDIPQPTKPVVEHEAGNYITFSRPSQIGLFQHNIKPFWLTAGKEKLEKLGLLAEADRWAEKSERLYLLLHKYNVEALRKNPWWSGYQWWLFQDYWTSANGLVDFYFRPKAIAPEEVLKFNNPVVLLQEGLLHTYRGQDRMSLKLSASNFSADALQGVLVWEVTSGDRSLAKHSIALNRLAQGELSEVGSIDLELPAVLAPTQLKITTSLTAGEKRFANDWTAWLYPAAIRPAPSGVPVFADPQSIPLIPAWDVRPIPSEGELSGQAVYLIGGSLDQRTIDALNRGASVVLLNGSVPFLKSRVLQYKTSWWKGSYPGQVNHSGTLVYDHPAVQAIAPDGWCDDGWFHLVEGGRKLSLESAPARPRVIIRGIPTLETVEDDALLFEVGVGKGVLVVSGLNHQRAQGRPENDWLIARLIDHAGGFPEIDTKWPVEFLAVPSADSQKSNP